MAMLGISICYPEQALIYCKSFGVIVLSYRNVLSTMLVLLVILAWPRCCGTLPIDDLQSTSSDLLEAADEIISSSFKSTAVTINFIVSLSDETKRDRSILINNLVARCDVVFIEDVEAITQRHRLYNVIFIDNFKSFLRLSQRMSSSTFVIDGFFLLIFLAGPIPEIGELTRRLWDSFIFNVDFLWEDESGLIVTTFYPFSDTQCDTESCKKNCGDTSLVIIDNFNGSFPNNKNFYPDKMSNLFQCSVKVVTFNCPPMMIISYDRQGNYQLKGPDGEMLKLVSDSLIFHFVLIHISDTIRWGALYENGTSTGAMAMVINNEADFTLGMYTITYLRSRFMTSSELYYSVPFILIVPPGVPLSPFEKLFRPFQLSVWILLLVTFATAALVVTAIKFQSTKVRNFVFGAKNKSPYLNILGIFVGDGTSLMPSRNFARFLLMMFLLFSIVKRTLYQGALFQFLQADDRAKEVQTIDELVEKNFKVYMMASSLEHTQNMKFRKQRVVVNSTVMEVKKRQTIDPFSNVAVTSSMEQVLYFNKMNYKDMTLTVCKEHLFTFQYGIYFRKNSFLEEEFNKKIRIFTSSGLIDFWASHYVSSRFLNMKMSDGSPKKLNIDELLGGFEVLLIGIVIGSIILLCEILSKALRMKTLQIVIEFFT